jgi:hypothetical protein
MRKKAEDPKKPKITERLFEKPKKPDNDVDNDIDVKGNEKERNTSCLYFVISIF